jgi:single-strand DNA-binding protein
LAASLNRVFLIGNLTRDPELRYLPTGQAVANFSLAVNRAYATQSGERKEEVTFIRIVAWAKLAEICNEYLKKGSPVCVEGRLQSRSWEAQDGTKRSTIEVIASSVQFLPRGGQGAGRTPEGEVVTEMNDEMPPASETISEKQNNEEVPF